MAYWLLKTEPEEFSWDDQVKRGGKGEVWSGVRNFVARRHLKEMKKGDKFFFYHTGDEKQVVGIGEIIREAYADPTAEKGEPWVAVTTGAVDPLPSPSFIPGMTNSSARSAASRFRWSLSCVAAIALTRSRSLNAGNPVSRA